MIRREYKRSQSSAETGHLNGPEAWGLAPGLFSQVGCELRGESGLGMVQKVWALEASVLVKCSASGFK